MKQGWKKALVRRRLFVAVLILLQAAVLIYFIASTSAASEIIQSILCLISIFAVLYIVGKPGDPNIKLSWMFLILLVPVFGGLLYLLCTFQSGTAYIGRLLNARREKLLPYYGLPNQASGAPNPKHAGIHSSLLRYVSKTCGYPSYCQTQCEYLNPGQAFFQRILEELEKAEKYIFLSFFIVEEGKMWDPILSILERKVQEGVDVRLIYDDVGCFLSLPPDYDKFLEGKGIRCRKFHPFQPILTSLQNQRNHRKILVIDGKVAFTGGANLADEYINAYEKHGYWQDSAICLKGKAAWSFTLIFLELWDYWEDLEPASILALYPWKDGKEADALPGIGLVQPYGDNPMDQEMTGRSAYLHIIQSAQDYVYITTPYLIIDDILKNALTLAAKSGIDVRIITPFIPDKPLVHRTTKSYYPELLGAGVKIYEFTPGFMHAKVFVSDDMVASVGSVNLDYRSLFHHFECGCLLYGTPCIQQIKQNYLSILEQCHPVTLQECCGGPIKRLTQEVLRLFAPLL